jgi:hypothetical protein
MSQGAKANGNIAPSRILVLDTTQPSNTVIQASSATATPLYGVAQGGTHLAPISGFDDGFAAVAGLDITVYTVGDTCQVEVGAAVSAGNLLTSNGSGQAIPSTTHGQYVVGEALENATAAAQYISMRVMPYMTGA